MKRYLVLLLLCFHPVFAQVQFEAKVSKPSLALNETLRVDFIMNADGDNFNPPNFEGFKIVGGPSQQISQSWINGKSAFNKVYSYYLMPMQRGPATIRQASIEINGQTYKTAPIRVNVTGAVQAPRNPNEPSQPSADDAIHLVAEVSKANPYINEPITVVYKLYLSYNIGISNWRELDKPKYNDFWSQNIDIKQLAAEPGTFNGEPVRVVVLRKTVLYPQKSGNLVIEPLTLDLDVQVPTGRRNMFGQQQIVEDNKRVSAGARTIKVKALPETGRPDDFSGAVGTFDFKVIPSKTTLHNGESLDLKVSVSGAGNLKLFDLPKPVVPSGLEMYEPVHKENVRTPLSGMNGKITDTYTIVPNYKGNYPIKPMQFSYFDLRSKSYKTISSPEIMIRVTDGPGMASATAATPTQQTPKQEIISAEQFKFIKLKTRLEPAKKPDFYASGLFYTLLFAPLLAIPLLMFVKRRKASAALDVTGNRSRLSSKLARKYLSEAKKNIGDKALFYISLEKALHNFLKAKLHLETSEMHKERIRELLLERDAQPQTVNDFVKLIEDCEFARYAPSTHSALEHDYEKAAGLLSELEKQLK